MDHTSLLESLKSPDSNNFEKISQETVECVLGNRLSLVTSHSQTNVKECSSEYNECISTQNEALVKIETDPVKYYFEEVQDMEIKNEELDIKEDLKKNETSISSDCIDQDSQGKCEIYPQETSDESHNQEFLKNSLWKTLPESDHCKNKTAQKTSVKKPFPQNSPKKKKVDSLTCSKCDFQTTQRNFLSIHRLQHINTKDVQNFKCDQCSYKTNFIAFLNRHLRRHRNPIKKEMFKCGKCDFQAKHKNSLTTHQVQHDNLNKLEMSKQNKCDFQAIFERSLGLNLY